MLAVGRRSFFLANSDANYQVNEGNESHLGVSSLHDELSATN